MAVAGGGPAGALAARQLAAFGFRVTLVHTPRRRRQHLGESLAASAPRLLGSYGLELDAAAFAPRPADHLVRWGGRETRIPVQPPAGQGEGQRLVRRDRLDAWALKEARRAGVRVIEGSVTGAVSKAGATGLLVRTAREEFTFEARAVVDATGRAGRLTRERREVPGPRTTAITGHFSPGARRATLIASFPDGWAWSAPVVDGRRDVTVMLDAEDARDPERAFHDAVGQVDLSGFADLEASPADAGLTAADATPYALATPVDEEGMLIAVGDAAAALDPLTGLGVMKAMDSGLTAAVVLRTALERPADRALAFGFHADKERGVARDAGARCAAFYAEETRFQDRPFWRRRARRAAAPPAVSPLPSPDAPLAAAPGARVRRQGVLEADWIVPAEVLTLPGRSRPAHRLGDIALAPVFRAVCRAGSLARARNISDLSGPDLQTAVGWLWREGFLAPGDDGRAASG